MPARKIEVDPADRDRWQDLRAKGANERAAALSRGPSEEVSALDRLAFYVGLFDDPNDPALDDHAEALIIEARQQRRTWREISTAINGDSSQATERRLAARVSQRQNRD